MREWDDSDVALRWLMLCPERRDAKRQPLEPTELEINGIRNSEKKLAELRSRLSDISWWMRLLSQNIAQRADKAGATPHEFAPLLERLGISAETWSELVRNFGRLFSVVAGKPTSNLSPNNRISPVQITTLHPSSHSADGKTTRTEND